MFMSNYRFLRINLLAAACSMVVACAGPQAARDVATETLSALSAYEKQVSEKITREKAFYRDAEAKLRVSIFGAYSIDVPADASDIKESLAWGRIVNRAHREARVASEALVNSPRPNVMTTTIAFVKSGVDADAADFRDLSERKFRLRTSFLKELVKFDQQKARLKKVQTSLETLSKKPSNRSQFKLIKEFAGPIKEAFEKLPPK